MERKLFVGVPTYNGWLREEAYEGLRRPSDTATWYVKPCRGSLLAYGFNRLWHTAYNSRKQFGWNVFAMHHADVAAPPLWADVLMDERERVGADILSAVIPIKDDRALTTTALAFPNGELRRLTMKEVFRLPETFDTATAQEEFGLTDCHLSVNTGLWVCDFDRIAPFLRPKHTGPKDPGLHFSVLDGVREEPNGDLITCVLPEDWHFSRSCRERGLKIFATRKVKVDHYGEKVFSNDSPWGTWETDLGDNPQSARLAGEPAPESDATDTTDELDARGGWTRIPFMAAAR